MNSIHSNKSRQLARCPEEELEGLSLIYFGFPVANSLPLEPLARKHSTMSVAHTAHVTTTGS